jgi:DNA-binding NarL/FixJ family response regulator
MQRDATRAHTTDDRSPKMSQPITVLLVDDHALVRRGFRRVLEDEAGITVVGEAGDGAEAVRLTRELKPKVVLMDFTMPGMNGLDATREIVGICPESSVLILSMHSENSLLQRMAKAGARGYILKNAVDPDFVSAIERVAAGELIFDIRTADALLKKVEPNCTLSPRELQVLQLIADGKSNKEIAAHLGLSQNTVGVHRANIMRELGMHKTAEIVAHAIRNRWVNIP